MKEMHLSLYANDKNLDVEDYIFEEVISDIDNYDSLYPIAYHKLVELKVIHEKRILFLRVTDEYNLPQFVEVANACAKSDTALIVAHHQDESLESKYQMVFPKVIYHPI